MAGDRNDEVDLGVSDSFSQILAARHTHTAGAEDPQGSILTEGAHTASAHERQLRGFPVLCRLNSSHDVPIEVFSFYFLTSTHFVPSPQHRA